MSSHEIELLPFNISGAGSSMYRLGRKFSVNEPVVLELTKEQVEVFENDWRFKVTKSNEAGQPLESGDVAESEAISSTPATVAAEEVVANETEAVQDSPVEQEEETSSEDASNSEIDELIFNNNRDELNAIAKDLGVKKPDKLGSKEEVAQAIVDAR